MPKTASKSVVFVQIVGEFRQILSVFVPAESTGYTGLQNCGFCAKEAIECQIKYPYGRMGYLVLMEMSQYMVFEENCNCHQDTTNYC